MPLTTLPFQQPTTSWLRGWNFTTDLYPTLEYASNRLRARHARLDDRIDVAAIFGVPAITSSAAAVLASITARYAALPAHFKMFAPPTGDRARDIFDFQAANIQAMLLLLPMLFLHGYDDPQASPNVQLKSNVAAELLVVFQTIPIAYLCGISTPLIYHLAGIGMIPGSVMEGPLSKAGYQKVEGMLLSIAALLESLESGLSHAADISKGLRVQVERIDEYMRLQRRPVGRSYAQPQPNHDSSVDAMGVPEPQQQQQQYPAPDEDVGIYTVGVGDDNGGAQVAGTEGAGAGMEGEFLYEWLGEFQLPPELLEDWPWPFNLQSESWSFLGTGVGAKEGGW